ncbi:MAG: DNA double-strand break repair nuclease NurA [Bacteroidales bacterium]|jgi:hypothetical protein|nr:DNA double-strand break repair nuclease NurA [Bacteroidales bacterium]
MSFEGEFASYEPLRRILDSEKIKALEARLRIQPTNTLSKNIQNLLTHKNELSHSNVQPDFVLAIDGSHQEVYPEKGFPGAAYGYIAIASVLIDLKKIQQLAKDDIIDPKSFRKTEEASTQESGFPGCNIIVDSEKDAKSSFRRVLFEDLKNTRSFSDGETLLDTYEYLFRIKREKFPETDNALPHSPIDSNYKMTYGYGEYKCPYSEETLFSTDALRLHELMNSSGSNGELFGQTMATLEKLWLVNILRAFENKKWLATLRRVAFIMDGPLAVFSTSSWLTKVIEIELRRINKLQKEINDEDLLIVGMEKSGIFFNHFLAIDTTKDGITDNFPKQTVFLLTDDYIKKNIIYSESQKPYGQDTYFGRKFFYKTLSGQKLVPVVAWFSDDQKDICTARPEQFARLGDILELLDQLASNRYPNSISPLISAHAEAAIPLNLGRRLFDDIAKEITKNSVLNKVVK